MKRLAAGISLVLVGTLVAIMLPAFSQVSAQTIRVCDPNRQGYSHDVDTGRKNFSAGDTNQFIDKIFSSQNGSPAGKVVGDLTVIRTYHRDALIAVDATYFTNRGKLTTVVQERFSKFGDGVHFPITGGSGQFKNATGEVRIKQGFCRGHHGLRFQWRVTT